MKFVIITHVVHKKIGTSYYGYGPYIKEMNLWLKYASKVIIVAPIDTLLKPEANELSYEPKSIEFLRIPAFDLTGWRSVIRTLFCLPLIMVQIVRGIRSADHIHLRCPGNVGLIGCFVQIFFPSKKKTAKYAGNWDWNRRQPWSYRLQQRIIRNTFLTRNMTALVYGDWPDKTRNIKPFFTASYFEQDRLPVIKSPVSNGLKLAFIGTLTENKSPLSSLDVLKSLSENGTQATMTICGDGPQRIILERKIIELGLDNKVTLLGNVDQEKVKEVLKEAHFLVFISKSEGWPKAVSEAMWWGCIPITTPVSCVPWMLDSGSRGELVSGIISEITSIIKGYSIDQEGFDDKSAKAMEWARNYTLEKFESEIKELL